MDTPSDVVGHFVNAISRDERVIPFGIVSKRNLKYQLLLPRPGKKRNGDRSHRTRI